MQTRLSNNHTGGELADDVRRLALQVCRHVAEPGARGCEAAGRQQRSHQQPPLRLAGAARLQA